jgi:hypothetical protein
LQRITAPFAIKKIHILHGIIRLERAFTGWRNTMPTSGFMIGRAAAIVLLSIGLFAGATETTLAAGTCLTKPNRPATAGSHWYYRHDRTNHRRCWYLKGAEPPPARAAAQQPAATPDVENQPNFMAWFSSVMRNEPAQETADSPDADEAAAQVGARRASKVQRRETAKAPSATTESARTSKTEAMRTSKTESTRTSGQASSQKAEGSDEENAPLDATERAALFVEFLRWREQQDATH